jgi:SET domain-containing protein
MRIKPRWHNVRKVKALAAPLGEVQTSAETRGSGNIVNINIKNSNESLAMNPEVIPLQDSNPTQQEQITPRRSLQPRVAKSYV